MIAALISRAQIVREARRRNVLHRIRRPPNTETSWTCCPVIGVSRVVIERVHGGVTDGHAFARGSDFRHTRERKNLILAGSLSRIVRRRR